MKTIQRTSSVLRRIAIAGLGAASLWTASLAHAAIAPDTRAALGGLQATLGTGHVSETNALPAPFLVAPDCGSQNCIRSRGNGTTASLRIAGGGCRGACMSSPPQAKFDEFPPDPWCKPYAAPLRASPYCNAGPRGPGEHATAERSPFAVAGGDPTTVRDSRPWPPLWG